ncbi:MAG: calcium-translocating P-type ATPase, SERCA-type, partial [Halanaerobiaceae bacterium]|nr:calcium-translocating P-type ATPase, SERCA-type [Halanaerobiaceae bacterium]
MAIEREYYLFNKEELQDLLAFTEDKGLSKREAVRRLYEYGRNIIRESDKKGVFTIFIDQFRDFMIMILMAASCLSFVMGEFSDAVSILAIIILNGLMGFIQEYRAEKSLAALKKLASPNARVIRDGLLEEVDAEELVPGDLIILEAGDRVPADARIISTKGLQVDESLLTGESVTVEKTERSIDRRGLVLAEQKNMLFMGTAITRGKCRAVVVATGMNTEMGRIAYLLEREENRLTPLQRRLKDLGRWLVSLSLIMTLLIVLIGILKGQSIYNMFMAGVSLAVAAIPEGLPAIVTLVLAVGVQKMSRNNAIVRKLQAVETLGCSTVICSDKTGTLTENQMSVKKLYINRRIMAFEPGGKNIVFEKILRIAALCSNVELRKEERRSPFRKVKGFFSSNSIPELMGDPTETTLVKAYYETGHSYTDLKKQYQVIAEEGFDSERKRMSVLVETPGKRRELWIKGAVELILERCKYIENEGIRVPVTNKDKADILKANEIMAGEALRVLAVAYRPFRTNIRAESPGRFENELVFVGLVGMIDPPRVEACQAVASCYRAGIRPVMITGDHSITAAVIAEELGIIPAGGKVMTGDELKKMADQELKEKVDEIQVYARIAPEEKLRIVRALREKGEIVAMTGDGVNDAPALKEADIGIAMGKKGTDVSKEVSALILADDNFATIVKAVEEGRKIYNNIRKFIKYLLACNIGELLSIFIGIVMGLPLPLLPIQILWVNLVTDGLPALALGLDNDSDDVMKRPPRDPEESIFSHGMTGHIISEGILIGISTMAAFLLAIYRYGADLDTARTMAFSTLVFSQLFFVFSCRSEEHSFWEIPLYTNMYLIGAVFISTVMQLAVIYLPFFSKYFQTQLLNSGQWSVVFLLSCWSTIAVDLI